MWIRYSDKHQWGEKNAAFFLFEGQSLLLVLLSAAGRGLNEKQTCCSFASTVPFLKLGAEFLLARSVYPEISRSPGCHKSPLDWELAELRQLFLRQQQQHVTHQQTLHLL